MKNMNFGKYLTIIGLIVCGVNTRAIDELSNSIENDDNRFINSDSSSSSSSSSSNNNNNGQPFGGAGEWVKINVAPPMQMIKQYGNPLELECEVVGSPAPIVQWIRGDKPQFNMENLDTNLITEMSYQSTGIVRSRLILDRYLPNDKTFTCYGQSGSKTVHSTTTVITANPSSAAAAALTINNNVSAEYNPFNKNILHTRMIGIRRPRIIYFYSTLFELQGTNIILPCKTIGKPHPEIYWLDSDDNLMKNGKDPNYKILANGNLMIYSLKWSDMGLYTCVAKNALGKDKISTFVYPVNPSSE